MFILKSPELYVFVGILIKKIVFTEAQNYKDNKLIFNSK